MSIFDKGTKWPPKNHQSRIELYKLMDALYRGDRKTWLSLSRELSNNFEIFELDADQKKLQNLYQNIKESNSKKHQRNYKVFNLLKYVIDKFTQLVSNKPIRLKGIDNDNRPAEYRIRQILTGLHLNKKFGKACKYLLNNGDAAFKARVGRRAEYSDATDQVMVDVVPPELVFPEFVPGSEGEMHRCHIVMSGSLMNNNEKENYLLVETHEPGKIRYSIYELDGDQVGQQITSSSNKEKWGQLWGGETPEEQETGVNRLLVWLLSWNPYKSNWGNSEFHPVLELLDDLNQKYGDLSHIHDVASSPMLKIPESMMEINNGYLEFKAKDVIPVGAGTDMESIGWIEIQGNGPRLTLEFINDLMGWLCFLTSTPRSFLKSDLDGAQPESAVAIEKKSAPTSLQSEGVIGLVKPALEEIVWYAQIIENDRRLNVDQLTIIEPGEQEGVVEDIEAAEEREVRPADYSPEYPQLEISYSIVEDMGTLLSNLEKKLKARLITRSDAILEANPKLNPEDIEEYQSLIDQDFEGTPAGQLFSTINSNLSNSESRQRDNQRQSLEDAAEAARQAGEGA